MANKTVILNNQVFAGTSGLTLLLINPTTGAIGNGSGDTLTAGANGNFSAVVTEAITGWWLVVVKQGAVPVIADELVYFPTDTEGTYLVNPNTYTLTSPTPVVPSPPGQVTGYWVVYDNAGLIDPGVQVHMELDNFPRNSTGLAVEDASRQVTSDSNGIAAFTNLFPGATYVAWLDGSSRKFKVTVPAGASGSIALGSIVG